MSDEKKRRRIELGEKFMKWAQSVPEPPPCLTCGRIVLAGRCCNDAKFPPWPACANCGIVFASTEGKCCTDPYFPDGTWYRDYFPDYFKDKKSDDTK
jgi:ribosomal protein L32